MSRYLGAVIFLTGYIVGWTVLAIGQVGEVIEVGVYDWKLPIDIFLLMVAPALAGYIIGKEK